MATNDRDRTNQASHDDRSLEILIKTLDEDQPYNKVKRFPVLELSSEDDDILRRIHGSLIGLAVGDALGAAVEFRPYAYLQQHPVEDMQSGGTWGLEAGQWTDDTSMTLCLAASLIVKGEFNPYDQFVRYKRWYRNGYMSSTGKCFDIGKATRDAITEFERRERRAAQDLDKNNKFDKNKTHEEQLDVHFRKNPKELNIGDKESAGNGSLMRVAPIPIFFFRSWENVMKYIDAGTTLTHGNKNAIDACRFYAGLIWYALKGTSKNELLTPTFYRDKLNIELGDDVREIAEGSYQRKKGYEGGIRGKGYVVNALEAALWAFFNDENSFEKGVLLAINLGDDTDTTAAIYGQLAGAVYGIQCIEPKKWIKQLFKADFIVTLATGLYLRGRQYEEKQSKVNRSDENDRRRDEPTGNKNRFQKSSDVGENAENKNKLAQNEPANPNKTPGCPRPSTISEQ